jgi:hypothetical protein
MARPNTEFVYVQGKGKWIRTKGINEWGKWTATIYPIPADLEKIKKLQEQGLKNHLKKDEDGYFMSFSRPFEKEFRDKNGTTRKVGFTAVEVVDDKGLPFDGLIGNGSDVTLKLEVYQHGTPGGGKAKAARLLGIRIDNLVPFSRDDFNDTELRATDGLDKVPAQPLF